jgi:hypothetical protein
MTKEFDDLRSKVAPIRLNVGQKARVRGECLTKKSFEGFRVENDSERKSRQYVCKFLANRFGELK